MLGLRVLTQRPGSMSWGRRRWALPGGARSTGPARSQLRSCCVIGSVAVGSRRDGPRPLAPHPAGWESIASPAMSHAPAECVLSSTPNPPTSVPGTAMSTDPWLDSEPRTPLPWQAPENEELFWIILEFP